MQIDVNHYKQLLKHYITSQNEKALYSAEQLTKTFIQNSIFPEEIVNIHMQSIAELYPNMYQEMEHAMNFLLETMISYGLAFQENQALREKQMEIDSELSVAASMQQTLLATKIPKVSNLDIGVISVPAHQMNGDYYHFVTGKDDKIGIAIADVIGKGIPAALCMSMIKYAMDSFPEQSMSPRQILQSLNRVVELNVDAGMFITMFYAQYNPNRSTFVYASAGHEPGFFYHAKTDTFTEITTKGLVLGVSPEVTYKEYEQVIEKGDMIVLLTDGVTECRVGGEFIEREAILEVLKQNKHLAAQDLVMHVYKYFERLQNFQLRDDFTLIVLKKQV